VRFAWSPSPDASVTGYKFFIGIKPTEYTDVTDVGNVTQAEADLLQGSTYFASVTAHNAIGLESLPAPELAFNTPILNESPTLILLLLLLLQRYQRPHQRRRPSLRRAPVHPLLPRLPKRRT
jgi:hypothetical protein